MSERKLLVLDLDETLIHTTGASLGRAADFTFAGYDVYRRPHLADFLAFAFATFDVGIWTAAGEDYAAKVVAEVFQDRPLRFVWSSERCTQRRDFTTDAHITIKRLAKLRRSAGYQLEHIIAVDDTAAARQCNYGNLVHVAEFTGAPTDDELLLLLPTYLAALAHEPNIRAVEKRGWRKRIAAP